MHNELMFLNHFPIAINCSNLYLTLENTKAVDNVEGARLLVRQTPNILCYLPPRNSRENGVPVCIPDK